MSRPSRIALYIGSGLLALVLVLAIAAVFIARTDWFRNLVRERIVAELEKSTGGRAELGRFSFDWRMLTARVDNLVLHGNEPAGADPLLRVRFIEVGLKVVSVFKREVDIARLIVDTPQVNVLVGPDGRTNIPEPKVKKPRDKSALETVLDLAVRRFAVENGTVQYASRQTPFSARGERLRAQLFYELAGPRYRGFVSVRPLQAATGSKEPLNVEVNVPVLLEKDRVEVSRASFHTKSSRLEFSADVRNMTAPRGSVRLAGELAGTDLAYFSAAVPPDLRRGPPVAIRLDASVENQRVRIAGASLALGASRIEASGSVDNLSPLEVTFRFDGRFDVGQLGRQFRAQAVRAGQVRLAGSGFYSGAKSYSVTAGLEAGGLWVQRGNVELSNLSASGTIEADPRLIRASDVRVNALGGSFAGWGEVIDQARFRAGGSLHNLALRGLARRIGERRLAWDGIISGPVEAAGSLRGARDLTAAARLKIVPGREGVPLTGGLNVRYDSRRDLVELDQSFVATPRSRLELAGTLGRQLDIRLVSQDLDEFLPVIALASDKPPGPLPLRLENGAARFEGTVAGPLRDPRVNGHIALTNFAVNEAAFARFGADIALDRSAAAVRSGSLEREGLATQFEGRVGLRDFKPAPDQPVSAAASIRKADLGTLLSMAGQKDVPVSGALLADARVSGTVGDPRATLDVTVTGGAAYGEPFDRFQASVAHSSRSVELSSGRLESGSARLEFRAAFEHPADNYKLGRLRFKLASNQIAMEGVPTVRKRRPGLAGVIAVAAEGAAELGPGGSEPRVRMETLDAKLTAEGVELDKRRLGNLRLAANTQGSVLTFQLSSDFANAAIRGDGRWRLEGDYPVQAEVAFGPLGLNTVRALVSPPKEQPEFDGVVEGKLSVSGPAIKAEDLKAALEVSKLELFSTGQLGENRRRVTLRNQEPLVVTLDRSVVRIRSAHLAGPSTDIQATGTVAPREKTGLDLRVRGAIGLEIAEYLDPDWFASGSVVLEAAVRGPLNRPALNGRLDLKDVSLNVEGVPNGLSHANGSIVFTGTQANIRNLTGESGGGKVSVGGFLDYGGREAAFRLDVDAKEVRVRYPSGTSSLANASVQWAGTMQRNLLSGKVTILEVAYQPQTDFGSMLSRTDQPQPAQSAQTGMTARMRLDIQVETAPNVRFQTAVAQNLQAEARLRVRGTAAKPGMLGRVAVTQGEVTFFGNRYQISRGIVSFFNPEDVEPILNVDLETQVRGILVLLTVAGPVKNLQLSYRSDPPLSFSEIIGLLATGRTPTSDPTLVARQEQTPQQTWQQMGASAVLSQAVANPLAGRLQRLFGVTKLKIDPKIAGVENNPQARLTLEQQVSKDLTFTYITDVTQSNPQIVRVEWALNPAWALILVREENGQVGVDFTYKKRFR